MKISWLAVFALLAAVALVPPTLQAHSGNAQGKGNPHADKKDKDKDKDKDRDQDRRAHDDDRDDKWERREGYEYRTYGENEGRPPGWSKGKKTGWGNCGVPPGQAKKSGCRTYVHQGRRHYYYTDDHGRIVVRREAPEVTGTEHR